MSSACGQLCTGVTLPYSLKMIKVSRSQLSTFSYNTDYIYKLCSKLEESVCEGI